jgi:predicted O-linked N-acetylglucosamine transferase (SPINDLY family)
MGLPVISCPGETFAGRHGLAHLTAAGLPEWAAADFDAYVDLAVDLASDLGSLSQVRAGLRTRVAVSSLCDGPRFAANFAGAMQAAWQCWRDSASGQK